MAEVLAPVSIFAFVRDAAPPSSGNAAHSRQPISSGGVRRDEARLFEVADLDVERVAKGSERRFLKGFPLRGMRVDGARNIFKSGAHFKRQTERRR